MKRLNWRWVSVWWWPASCWVTRIHGEKTPHNIRDITADILIQDHHPEDIFWLLKSKIWNVHNGSVNGTFSFKLKLWSPWLQVMRRKCLCYFKSFDGGWCPDVLLVHPLTLGYQPPPSPILTDWGMVKSTSTLVYNSLSRRGINIWLLEQSLKHSKRSI